LNARALVAALLVAELACSRADAPRGALFRPLRVGDRAPAYTAHGVHGDTVAVGSGAPVLLNVWATWCTSCREEMTDLGVLSRAYASKGVKVVAVSVDAGDGARVRRFADAERLPFVVAHDPDGEVQRRFQAVGVPETYLISATGTLLWVQRGGLHGAASAVRATLDSAIAMSR